MEVGEVKIYPVKHISGKTSKSMEPGDNLGHE